MTTDSTWLLSICNATSYTQELEKRMEEHPRDLAAKSVRQKQRPKKRDDEAAGSSEQHCYLFRFVQL